MAKINSKIEKPDAGLDVAQKTSFFPEAGRGKTLLHIVNLARFNPGIIMLMGDDGSGRSFLLHHLSLRVNQKPGLLAIIDRVVKTKPDLYRAIAESFSVETSENESIDTLEEKVLDYLQGCFVTHRPVILAVDNIQQFSLSMLEELLKLMGRYKKISLLLVGDNNLSAMLRHLDTGKAHRHEIVLQPQTRGEMRQFINWRLPFALDDREFEDIVNTTKGNFALLEREAQKKEAAHQGQEGNRKRKISVLIQSRKWFLAAILCVIVVTAGALFYFARDTVSVKQADNNRPTPVKAPMPEAVVTPATENTVDANRNDHQILDRQMELLTANTDDVKPRATDLKPEIHLDPVVETPPVITSAVTVELTKKNTPEPDSQPVLVKPVETGPEVITSTAAPGTLDAEAPTSAAVIEKNIAGLADDDSEKLLSMNARHYSIQLLGGRSKKTIDTFMVEHKNLDGLRYFRSERDGKDWYIVVFGEYSSRQEAILAANALPEELKKTSPWPRRISEIHALINARSTR